MADTSSRGRPPPTCFSKAVPPDPQSRFDAWAADRLLQIDPVQDFPPRRSWAPLVYPKDLEDYYNNYDWVPLDGLMANCPSLQVVPVNHRQWVCQVPVGNNWLVKRNNAHFSVYLDNIKLRIRANSFQNVSEDGVSNKRIGFRVLVVEIDHEKSEPVRTAAFSTGGVGAIPNAGPVWQDFVVEPNMNMNADANAIPSFSARHAAAGGFALQQRCFNSPLRPKYRSDMPPDVQFDVGPLTAANIVGWTNRYNNVVATGLPPASNPIVNIYNDIFGPVLPLGAPADKIWAPSPFYYRVLHDQQYFLSDLNSSQAVDTFTSPYDVSEDVGGTTHYPAVYGHFSNTPAPKGGSWESLIPVRSWVDWVEPVLPYSNITSPAAFANKSIWILVCPNQSKMLENATAGVPPGPTFCEPILVYDPLPVVTFTDFSVEQLYAEGERPVLAGEQQDVAYNNVDGRVSNEKRRRDVGSEPRNQDTLRPAGRSFNTLSNVF